MTCWSVNVIGAVCIGILIFDIIMGYWKDLPWHALIGSLLTALILGVCMLLNDGIAFGIIVVPLTCVLVFMLGIWYNGKGYEKQGCCISCAGGAGGAVEEKKNDNKNPPADKVTVKTNFGSVSLDSTGNIGLGKETVGASGSLYRAGLQGNPTVANCPANLKTDVK
jgi:hypothetical protein